MRVPISTVILASLCFFIGGCVVGYHSLEYQLSRSDVHSAEFFTDFDDCNEYNVCVLRAKQLPNGQKVFAIVYRR